MGGLFDGTSLERPVTCAHCGKQHSECECPRSASGEVLLPADQQARVQREKKRGKWTTVVTGLDPDASDLKGLLKSWKARFGAGGAVEPAPGGARIVLQGDHADAVIESLQAIGYPAKRAGG